MAQTQFSAITRFQLVQMWSTIFKSFILHGAFKTHSVSRTAPDEGNSPRGSFPHVQSCARER
jgi:hypothetical protein